MFKHPFTKMMFSSFQNRTTELAEMSLEFLRRSKLPHNIVEELKMAHFDSVMLGFTSLAAKSRVPSLIKHSSIESKKGSSKYRAFLGSARPFGAETCGPISKAAASNVSSVCDIESFPVLSSGLPLSFLCIPPLACQEHTKFNGSDCVKGFALLIEAFKRFDSLIGEKGSLETKTALAVALVYASMKELRPKQTESALGLTYQMSQIGLSDENDFSVFKWGYLADLAISMCNLACLGLEGPSDIIGKLSGDQENIGKLPIELYEFSEEALPMKYRLGTCLFETQSFIHGFWKSIFRSSIEFNSASITTVEIKVPESFLPLKDIQRASKAQKDSENQLKRAQAQKDFIYQSKLVLLLAIKAI